MYNNPKENNFCLNLLLREQSYNSHQSYNEIYVKANSIKTLVSVQIPLISQESSLINIYLSSSCPLDFKDWFIKKNIFYFPVHPELKTKNFSQIKPMYYTSSLRTLSPANFPIMAIKLSRPEFHDQISSIQIQHAIWLTDNLIANHPRNFMFLPEYVGAVMPYDDNHSSFLVRSLIPKGGYLVDINKDQLFPSFQLFDLKYLATIKDPSEFFFKVIHATFSSITELLIKGILPSPHSQNILFLKLFSGQIHTVHKDLNGFYIDPLRWSQVTTLPYFINLLDSSNVLAYRSFTFDTKLTKLFLVPLIDAFSQRMGCKRELLIERVKNIWKTTYQPTLPPSYFPSTVYYPDEQIYKTAHIVKLLDTKEKPLLR